MKQFTLFKKLCVKFMHTVYTKHDWCFTLTPVIQFSKGRYFWYLTFTWLFFTIQIDNETIDMREYFS